MNDAYGDPRNYDPNDPYWDENNYDPTWGPSPQDDPYAPPAATPPITTTTGAPPPPTTGGGKTPQQIEAEGREYDRQHGLIGGYMNGNIWVNGSPSTSGPNTDTDPFTPRAQTGAFNLGRPPGLLPYPGYESPGALEIDPFTPSSWDDAENEPGFQQSQDRLSKRVQNSAAYQGVLRSGMTIGNLDSVLDSNRGQNFAQFDARRYRNWEGNAGMKVAAFDRRATDFDRKNNYQFNVADRSFSDELARWQEQVRSLTSLATPK